MEAKKAHCTAIVLAAGSGKRMNSATAKQYILLEGKPIIWYSLNAVEESQVVEDCILVAAPDDIEYVQEEIVEKYGFQKVRAVVPGGKERYESVHNALQAIKDRIPTSKYVFIHDGARPFLTEKILLDTYQAVVEYKACVAAMPVKDTIKISDENGFIAQTPNRNLVWAVQTPQVFERDLITDSYERLMNEIDKLTKQGVAVTDDTFVAQMYAKINVKLVETSYENIKITTPEDLKIAAGFLNK